MTDETQQTVFADTAWVVQLTGWSHDKVSRLAKSKTIPGAYRPTRTSQWTFRKQTVLDWLNRGCD